MQPNKKLALGEGKCKFGAIEMYPSENQPHSKLYTTRTKISWKYLSYEWHTRQYKSKELTQNFQKVFKDMPQDTFFWAIRNS